MKKLIAIFIGLTVYCFNGLITPVHAFYDPRSVPNNKVGVHILNTSELDAAAKLVNNNGGDWGYVTIPIQPTDRDRVKWQDFMHKAKDLHLIPIIRITTIPQGGTWATGQDTDLVDFANFLNELDWPIENRYIVLFNEVNRDTEWGGTVDPGKYAQIVKNARSIFKERSDNFFLLGPALDDSLPNSKTSLSAATYLNQMAVIDPMVWSYFDGWVSHSYPNPGFTASPKKTGLQSIVSYKSEMSLLHLAAKPIFITETGWDQTKIKDPLLSSYWNIAWKTWQQDGNVVVVTPFVLAGGDQFAPFSLVDSGNYTASGKSLSDLPKQPGIPKLSTPTPSAIPAPVVDQPVWSLPFFKNFRALIKLENIFRTIVGLPVKGFATLKDIPLTVELAETPSQWEHGLSGRTSLEEGSGMLFLFPQYHVPIFWMKDMQFDLDMIWLAGGKVVDITVNAPRPTSDKLPTYSPRQAVNMVLEVPAGWSAKNNITIGDQLAIQN
jgi:uncharacterized membrane protein (UPF0127 family)